MMGCRNLEDLKVIVQKKTKFIIQAHDAEVEDRTGWWDYWLCYLLMLVF